MSILVMWWLFQLLIFGIKISSEDYTAANICLAGLDSQKTQKQKITKDTVIMNKSTKIKYTVHFKLEPCIPQTKEPHYPSHYWEDFEQFTAMNGYYFTENTLKKLLPEDTSALQNINFTCLLNKHRLLAKRTCETLHLVRGKSLCFIFIYSALKLVSAWVWTLIKRLFTAC